MSGRLEALEDNIAGLLGKATAFAASQYGRNLQDLRSNNGDGTSTLVALGKGDTAFLILCTALVLMMTIPGLGLYYSGMVSVKNVLACIMQSFMITCLITVLFFFVGYSLAFGPAAQAGVIDQSQHSDLYIGDGSRLWYWGLGRSSVHQLATSIPESVYATYQLTFAIITAALITGSFADRVKFNSLMIFICIWHVAVYCPIAHANWHPDGFLFKAGIMDFAGGNVVHIASGMAGLMTTIVIGPRKGFGKHRFDPHNILLTFIGASLLWVGWFGFNGGSAGGANARAGFAMLNTQLATSMGALSWMSTEWAIKKKPSVLGMLSGAVSGLVAITPGCGWVDPTGAFFIGLMAGPWCYMFAQLKQYAGYDDALDAFGVHATGGTLGGILTGFFAAPKIFTPFLFTFTTLYPDGGSGSTYYPGVFYAIDQENQGAQLGKQLYGIACTILYSSVATFIIAKAVDMTIGLRVTEEEELLGLDASLHGETIIGGSRKRAISNSDEAASLNK